MPRSSYCSPALLVTELVERTVAAGAAFGARAAGAAFAAFPAAARKRFAGGLAAAGAARFRPEEDLKTGAGVHEAG